MVVNSNILQKNTIDIEELRKPTLEKMVSFEISEHEQIKKIVKKNMFSCICCTFFRKKKDALLDE
jgi:hypothetical protein